MTTGRSNKRSFVVGKSSSTREKSMLSPLVPARFQSASRRYHRSVLVIAFVAFGAFGTSTQLFAQSSNDWHTGKRLDRFNQTPISASWTDTPLRQVLNRFSESQHVATFLDRRVDPSSPVNIVARNLNPEHFIWEIADSQELGMCRVADFYFLGPPETAASLPTLWQEMESQSGRHRKTFKVQWERKSTLTTNSVVVVKQLLDQLADEHGFKIENPDAIAHDVWGQVGLPETSVAGRVGIILVGFGKWFERSKDGTTIKIIDFPSIKSASFRNETLSDPAATAKRMKPAFPDLKISGNKKRLTASGPPLEVARLRRKLAQSQTVEPVAPENNRFSLNTKAIRGKILATVARQLGLELKFTAQTQPQLEEEIELQVKDASLSQLLDETLKGTGLKYETTDSELIISSN